MALLNNLGRLVEPLGSGMLWSLTSSVIRGLKATHFGISPPLPFQDLNLSPKQESPLVAQLPKLTSASSSRVQRLPFTCEHSKDPTTMGKLQRLLWKVPVYLNCKATQGSHCLWTGTRSKLQSFLHGCRSISQFFRHFSSCICMPPWVFPSQCLQSVAIFCYKVFRILINTYRHCHHFSENWWPTFNAHY